VLVNSFALNIINIILMIYIMWFIGLYVHNNTKNNYIKKIFSWENKKIVLNCTCVKDFKLFSLYT